MAIPLAIIKLTVNVMSAACEVAQELDFEPNAQKYQANREQLKVLHYAAFASNLPEEKAKEIAAIVARLHDQHHLYFAPEDSESRARLKEAHSQCAVLRQQITEVSDKGGDELTQLTRNQREESGRKAQEWEHLHKVETISEATKRNMQARAWEKMLGACPKAGAEVRRNTELTEQINKRSNRSKSLPRAPTTTHEDISVENVSRLAANLFRSNVPWTGKITARTANPLPAEETIARIRDAKDDAALETANVLFSQLSSEEGVTQALAQAVAYAKISGSLPTELRLQITHSLVPNASFCPLNTDYKVCATVEQHDCKAIYLKPNDSESPRLVLFKGTEPSEFFGIGANICKGGVGKDDFAFAKPTLESWIDDDHGRPIWVLGHSLGGTMAARFFGSLPQSVLQESRLWTFGPAGVELDTVQSLREQEAGSRIKLIWHEWDIVKTCGATHPPGLLYEYHYPVKKDYVVEPHCVPVMVLADLGQLQGDLNYRTQDLAASPYQDRLKIAGINVSEAVRKGTGQVMELIGKKFEGLVKNANGT